MRKRHRNEPYHQDTQSEPRHEQSQSRNQRGTHQVTPKMRKNVQWDPICAERSSQQAAKRCRQDDKRQSTRVTPCFG